MSLGRVTAIITLILFTLNLGDWPYTDEILDELNQQVQVASADAAGVCLANDGSDADSSHPKLDFQSQLSLQNVVPPLEDMWSGRSDLSHVFFCGLHAPRPDFVGEALFRPPAV